MDTPTIREFTIDVTIDEQPVPVRVKWSYHMITGAAIHSVTGRDGQDVRDQLSQRESTYIASEVQWAAAGLSMEERQAEFLRHYKSRGAHSLIKTLSADQKVGKGAA